MAAINNKLYNYISFLNDPTGPGGTRITRKEVESARGQATIDGFIGQREQNAWNKAFKRQSQDVFGESSFTPGALRALKQARKSGLFVDGLAPIGQPPGP
jgi:hypothetical protein